ncbi:MAG: hypothetical protein V4693_05575 [Pseudomonadota bacterium]
MFFPLLAAAAAVSNGIAPEPGCAFRYAAGRAQARAALLHHTTAASTPLRLGHKSFAVMGPLALLGSAFYAVRVPQECAHAGRTHKKPPTGLLNGRFFSPTRTLANASAKICH